MTISTVAIGEKKPKRNRVIVPAPHLLTMARTLALAILAVVGAAYGVYRGYHYKPMPMLVPAPTEIPAPDLTTTP